MHLSLSSVIRLTMLVMAVAVSFILIRQQRTPAPSEASRPLPPGYYLRSAVLAGTDAAGQLLYNISAELIEERPEDNRVLLSKVQVNYRPVAEVPWDVSSDNGVARMDESFIDLFGDVQLTSNPEPPETATIIRTDTLRLKPDEFVAETPDRVRVEMDGRQLRATGLVAYLKEDRLELQSNVNGQFRP